MAKSGVLGALGSGAEEFANVVSNIASLGTMGGRGEQHLGGAGQTVGTTSQPAPILQALGFPAQPKVFTPEEAAANLAKMKAAKTAAPGATPATTGAQGPTTQDLLSAILGGEQGQVPKGYADFFTQVLGPLMAQASQLPSTPVPQADLNAMTPQDRAAFSSAYGQQVGSLQDILKGNQLSNLAAPGLQQFVTGPLGNYQKLIQQLQNALSFIPYSAQGIANLPVQASSVLAQLGINPASSALGIGAAPGATGTPPPLSPAVNPGAVVTAGG